jgi:hypothetical protein
VALNRFPIVYINDDVDDPDDLFDDEDFIRTLVRYVKNGTVYDNAKVCIRVVVEEDSWVHIDKEYQLNEKITKEEYGKIVGTGMGDVGE